MYQQPIHLGPHAWQSLTAVLSFSLKVTIFYGLHNWYYLVLAIVFWYLWLQKNQQVLCKKFFQELKLRKFAIYQWAIIEKLVILSADAFSDALAIWCVTGDILICDLDADYTSKIVCLESYFTYIIKKSKSYQVIFLTWKLGKSLNLVSVITMLNIYDYQHDWNMK